MGWFSKSDAAATTSETLPTSTAPAKAAATTPTKTDADKVEKGGIFCGMSLSEILIAIVIFGLFFFFVIWPLITAYFMLACCWIILWPFVKYVPACANHKYVGPGFTVLSVIVTSPVKVCKYLYKSFKHGKEEKKPDDAVTAAANAAVAAAAQSVMQQNV